MRQAQILGNFVSGFEAHAVNISGELVRVLLHSGERGVPVGFIDLDRQVGADAMTVQKEHDIFDLTLLLPGLGDLAGALGADIGHFAQALGLLFDDVEGFSTEVIDDTSGQFRTDPFNQPGAQVAFDPIDGGGQGLLTDLGVELSPVFGVVDPAPFEGEVLPGVEFGQVTDHGCQSIAT